MKKGMRTLLALLLCATFLLGTTSCDFGTEAPQESGASSKDEANTPPADTSNEWGVVHTLDSAYLKACSLGYSGTLQEFLASIQGSDGQNGIDGIGIREIAVNDAGELVITLTSDQTFNLGRVIGKDGEDGKDGKDGQNGADGKDGENGKDGLNGTDGKDGEDGKDGTDGVGIKTTTINADGELIITLTDGSVHNLGNVIGKDGEDGQNGTDGKDGENGKDGLNGTDGKDGTDGVGIKTTAINANGELIITLTDGTIHNLGKVVGADGQNGADGKDGENGKDGVDGTDGEDGASAYEIYKQHNPSYTGTEAEWLADLAAGRLNAPGTVDFVPPVRLQVAAGETVQLPTTVFAYLEDGSIVEAPVVWRKASVSTDYLGYRELIGDLTGYNATVTCAVQVVAYASAEHYVDGYVNGLLGHDKALVTLYNDTYLSTVEVGSDGYYRFDNLPKGNYKLKVDAMGYETVAIANATVADVTTDTSSLYSNIRHINLQLLAVRTPGYYFSWTRVGAGSTETAASINTPIKVKFVESAAKVSDIGYASLLRDRYHVVLLNDATTWSTETVARFYELYAGLPTSVTDDLKSTWTLVDYELQHDIDFELIDGVYQVKVAKSAIENLTPRVALSEGEVGSYFSKRFYHAMVRFVTDNGTNADKCEAILTENFSTSFRVPDYEELTRGITNEDASQFQDFYPEEKIQILTMFEEMPVGMHKMPELKYLVRRKTGQSHPIYPDAAAVTWTTAAQPYIEFMGHAFGDDAGYYEMRRLIIHEKMHMYYEYYFSDALKAEWESIGGWYKNEADADGWSTTKQTEFVSAYAHAHNPDEDMAESAATYIINPDLLRSRSINKYNFIKNYIMQGSFYLTQIREDLTFEVYNLNPDYIYPGQIDQIDVQVAGGLFEDKVVTVNFYLQDGGSFSGASGAFMRLQPGDPEVSQFYDIRLQPMNEAGTWLQGHVTVSKHSYQGYWYTDQIVISDNVGNERYEGNSDFSFKVYIDNPLADLEAPDLVRGSLELSLEDAQDANHPGAQYLIVRFAYTENVRLNRALVRLYCKDGVKESIDVYAAAEEIDHENGIVTLHLYIPEHYSSGTYEISEIVLWDIAENTDFWHVDYGTLVDEKNTIEIITPNPDNQGPTLDVNNIGLVAVPSHPESPNGETFVTLKLRVKDDISGAQIGQIRFVDPQGISHHYWLYFPRYNVNYFEGDPTVEQEYTFQITLPEGSAPGKWGIYEIALTDCALSTSVYNFTEIVHFEVSAE